MVTLVTGVSASDIDPKTGNIIINLQGVAPKPYGLEVHRGCVVSLVLTLVGQMRRSREKFGDVTDFQAATLTDARPYVDPHGHKHLELTLDHALPIPIALDEKSARGLQAMLQELIASGKLRPSPKLN